MLVVYSSRMAYSLQPFLVFRSNPIQIRPLTMQMECQHQPLHSILTQNEIGTPEWPREERSIQWAHVGHVRSKPDCLLCDWPLWFVTFFRVSVETHMTARDVRVTWQPNGAIKKHSTRKSTLFKPIILPRQSETSSHCIKEGSADVSRSTWRPFCSKHGHVRRTSCDLLSAKS